MKMLFLLLSILLYTSSSFANCKGTHYIYLIHGIAASGTTFGSMAETLEKQLLDQCIKIKTYEYDTGNRFKTIWDFAKKFEKESVFNKLKKDDTFSMVMHSQGGLVGLAFLELAKVSPNFHKIDSFITLSTPFHGAHVAKWGDFFLFIDGRLSPFGKQELIGMKYGSLNYYQLINAQKNLLPQTRALSFGGYSFKHGGLLGEDDNIVPVYSSRTNSIFLDARAEYKNNELTCGAQPLNSVPYILVKASHFKFDRHGIAKIPPECINDINCGHPALIPIIDHLNGRDIEQKQIDNQKQLSRFRVTLYIESSNAPKVEVLTYPESNRRILADIFKLGVRPKKIAEKLYSYSFDSPMKKMNQSIIEFEVSSPGMKSRRIFTEVKSGTSTNIITKLDEI